MADDREQRGLALAALYRIDHQDDGKYLVPSQSGDGTKYVVDPDPEHPHCTCPDHRDRGIKCKHLFAVGFVMTRETAPNGSVTVTKTTTIKERVTYSVRPVNRIFQADRERGMMFGAPSRRERRGRRMLWPRVRPVG